MTARAAALSLPPLLVFAVIAWVVWASAVGLAPIEGGAELVGVLALVAVAGCAYIFGRLYPRGTTPDLRFPFVLNAIGLGAMLVWFSTSLIAVLLDFITHRFP